MSNLRTPDAVKRTVAQTRSIAPVVSPSSARFLSMKGPLSLPPPPAAGERVAEGRERGGGSWSQCALKMASSLPMNRRFVLVVVLVVDIPSRLGVFEDE